MHLSVQTNRQRNRLDSKLIYSGFDSAAQSSGKLCNTFEFDKDFSVTNPYETQMT